MNYGLLSFIFLCISAAIYLFFKTYQIIVDHKKTKFNDDKSEFMSDCYKLIQKWSKKGKFEYCKGLSLVIESFNIPEEKPTAQTDYGVTVYKQMKDEGEDE